MTPARPPATAARMYDYFLGGYHHFPADRDAAEAVIAQIPDIRLMARANRDFLGRAVRWLIGHGVYQFLDIGSGIPTEGNVHDIAHGAAPQARVVYVDIDPVAVAESLELLDGNPHATAICGDLRDPPAILNHRAVRDLLRFAQPIGLLMAAVLHFVPDDAQAHASVSQFVSALPTGSYLVVSHAAMESVSDTVEKVAQVYQQKTATPGKPRTHEQTATFLTGLCVVEPGVVWLPQWHPDPDRPPPAPLIGDPHRSGAWAGIGKIGKGAA
jgi:S-adenosyl methyltransferase